MKHRSFLTAGCVAACLSMPQALLAQFQSQPMNPSGGGNDQGMQVPQAPPVFEFIVMEGLNRAPAGTVVCVDKNGTRTADKNSDGVYSVPNPPKEFELFVERPKLSPMRVKVNMPATQSGIGSLSSQRQSVSGGKISNQTAVPVAGVVVRAIVDITDGKTSVIILDAGFTFDAIGTILTKNGQIPRPLEAGAGRAGDDCPTATPLACGDTETFTAGPLSADAVAFTSTCEIAVGGPFGNDKSAWFEFTADASGSVQIDFCSSAVTQDSVMTLFTADTVCGALTELACDDDSCPGIPPPGFGAPSMIAGGLVPGQTYLLLVDFYTGGYDPLADNTITVTCGVALPMGACCMPGGACTPDSSEGDCVSAGGVYQGDNTVCDGSCPDGAGDVCTIAVEVFNGMNSGTIFESGIDDPSPSCSGFGADDTWFMYTATTAGSLLIETCGTFQSAGTAIDTIVSVYDGCGGAELGCDDDCASVDGDPPAPCRDADQTGTGFPRDSCVCIENVNVGDQFWIQVQDFLGGNFGDITVTVTPGGCDPPAIVGACCGSKSCTVETETDCVTFGGTYLGDDTSCEGAPAGNPVSFNSNPNAAIPDNDPVGVSDTINVGDSFAVGDVNLTIQIDHTFLGDLDITLTHNGATSALVMSGVCATNDNMNITIDDAGGDVVCATPTVGTFNSLSLGGDGLSAFNGENSGGNWTLTVVDTAGLDLGTLLSWSLELDGAGPGPCDEPVNTCTADLCPAGTTAIVGIENGNFAGWCVSGAPVADVDFFFFRVDFAGDFALIEITKEFTQGPQAPTGLIPPILVTFFQVCDDGDTVGSIIIGEESVRNSTGVDWSDYHWNLFDGTEVWFDVAGSAEWSTLPFANSSFANFIDAPANMKAKTLNADNGSVPNNSQYFPGSGTGVLKMDVDLSGPPVNFTFKQRPTIPGADPDGACCNSGVCTDSLTQAACEGGGGTYQGDGSVCSGVTCPVSGGDVCVEATEAFDGLNMGAITDGGVDDPDPSCTGSGSADTWFMYTATTAGSLLIETCGTYVDDAIGGSEVDTIVAVYDACGGNELECDDDCTSGDGDPPATCRDAAQEGTGTRDSCVCIENVNVGDQFWIQVQEFLGNNFDDISLTITPGGCDPAPPAGNDTCDAATGVNCGDNLIGESNEASNGANGDYSPGGFGNACTGFSAPGPDVVYELNLPATQDVTIVMSPGATLDASLYVVTDCADPEGTCVAGDDSGLSGGPETVTFSAVAGTTYFIIADAFGAAGGTFDLSISCAGGPAGGACCNSDTTCDDVADVGTCKGQGGVYQGDGTDCATAVCVPPASGDVCVDAFDAFDGLNVGPLFGGGVDDPDPSCGFGSDDTWFMYTATTAGSLLIDSCGTWVLGGSEVDTIVAVFDACGGNELDCDDDCGSSDGDPPASCRDADQTGTGGTRDSCVCVDSVNVGDQFWIQVRDFAGGNFDDISLNITPGGCDPPAPVLGACCDTGACTPDMTQANCEAGGGTYQGDGTDCSVACPQPATNDECEGREALSCAATTFADLADATSGADDPSLAACSNTLNPCTEYFEFVPTGTSARIRTDLNSTETDSVYGLYQVNQAMPCDETQWVEVACSEDEGAGFLGDICVDGLTIGDTYVLMITGFNALACPDGPYGIDVDCAAVCGP
ncbi:MAG: hypothetical protein GXP29_00440 [Planctomycetes bacterium]|nr:hypothetical protein [Planctomycetota bacterium]